MRRRPLTAMHNAGSNGRGSYQTMAGRHVRLLTLRGSTLRLNHREWSIRSPLHVVVKSLRLRLMVYLVGLHLQTKQFWHPPSDMETRIHPERSSCTYRDSRVCQALP